MVLRFCRDYTCFITLFKSADAVHESFCSGNGPIARAALFVTLERSPCFGHLRCHIRRFDSRIFVQVRKFPSRRTVGDEGIGQQYNRSHVLKSYFGSHVGGIKAVSGRSGCNDGHRAFAIASVEGLQQVGLFRFGWHTGRRSSTLYINYDQWQFGNNSQVHGFAFQADTRSRSRCYSQIACKSRTNGRSTSGNFVLTLNGFHPH